MRTVRRVAFSFRAFSFACVLATLACTGLASARDVRVGILTDGPAAREVLTPESLVREATAIYAEGLTLVAPADKQLNGNWTIDGLNTALDRLEADPAVDVVVTLGFVASHVAAHRAKLPKPTIAALAVDPVLQTFPLQGGTSGRHNFTFVASFDSVGDEIGTFHRVIGFSHMAVLADRLSLQGVPELQTKAAELRAQIGAEITLAPTDSVADALNNLPANTDAVLVAPLLRLSKEEIRALADGLAKRKLPSFSLLGRSEVEQGILLTTSPDTEQAQRLARRIALNIQRIVGGEDAARLELAFPSEQRLAVNMRTAALIGFSPRWDDLTDAIQVAAVDEQQPKALNLVEALNAAIGSNPSLRAAQLGADIASDEARIARGQLLPSLTAEASHTKIDSSHANPLFQAEETTAAGGQFKQVLYSDSAWAGWAVSRRLAAAANEEARQELLDTVDETATGYFNVLRAKSVEAVRRQNVENTRKNLETARVREAVGLSERSDYLRWVAEMARARQDLLSAEANSRLATTELARLIHHDSTRPLVTGEQGIDDPLNWVASARTQRYLDTPAKWEVFQDFILTRALEHSPEVKRVDELIAGQERLVTSARRAFFIPDLVAVASASDDLNRNGAGSERIPSSPDDTAWSVGVQATLPIFSGGTLLASLSQNKHQLRQLTAQRDATSDAVGARARSVLARITSSYPSIALSRQAAEAARDNYGKVTDAYARGLVSVTDLISAQDASLGSDLAQAQAIFTFLIDFADTLRVSNNFDLLLDPQSRATWYDTVDAWFRDHGVRLPPR
ncbi:MAG TPA: TolC family protein [Steroidobacteraceae bacterium]|nr:TolC family protein [Steroidobacteraceae bacterium]